MASPRPKPSDDPAPIEVNGWKIYAHPLFLDQLEALIADVEKLRKADSEGYKSKKPTKLLAAILKVGLEVIPSNPADRSFYLGNTLGSDYRHWHRAKFFDGRYRLFFRYSSSAKAIVLAWVNDEDTLRTYGSNTDAYAVFGKMLGKGNPPDDWDSLMAQAKTASKRAAKNLRSR